MRRDGACGVGPRLPGETLLFGIQTQGLRHRVRQPLAQGFWSAGWRPGILQHEGQSLSRILRVQRQICAAGLQCPQQCHNDSG